MFSAWICEAGFRNRNVSAHAAVKALMVARFSLTKNEFNKLVRNSIASGTLEEISPMGTTALRLTPAAGRFWPVACFESCGFVDTVTFTGTMNRGSSQMKDFKTNKLLTASGVSLLASVFVLPLLERIPSLQSLEVSPLVFTLLRVALASLATYLFYAALIQSVGEGESGE